MSPGDDVKISYYSNKKDGELLLTNGPSLVVKEEHSTIQSPAEAWPDMDVTLSRYPQQPSEEYVARALGLLHRKFGLDPSCEFHLRDKMDRYYDLRNVLGGKYNLELTSTVTAIPSNSINKEGVRTTVTGSARILAEAHETKLQACSLCIKKTDLN